jgi:hypothetical protein
MQPLPSRPSPDHDNYVRSYDTSLVEALGTQLIQSISNPATGEVFVNENLVNDEVVETLPIFPTLENKVRYQQLQGLLKINAKKTTPGGLSRLVDIFEDYIEECFKMCRAKVPLSRRRVQSYSTSQPFDHKALNKFIARMKVLFGQCAIAISGLQKHARVIWVIGPLSIKQLKNIFTTNYDDLLQLGKNIRFESEAPGIQLIDACVFFKEIVCDEIELLDRTLEEDLNIAHHFERLMVRINRLKNMISNFEDFEENFTSNPKFKKDATYRKYWKEDTATMLGFCAHIEKEVSQISQTPAPAPKVLREVYLKFYGSGTRVSDQGCQLFSTLFLNKEFDSLYYLIANCRRCYGSIIEEGTLAILSYLIKTDVLKQQEIYDTLINLYQVFNDLDRNTEKLLSLDGQFQSLKSSNLSENDQKILEFLFDYQNQTNVSVLKQLIYHPIMQTLQVNLKKQTQSRSPISCALCLREGLFVRCLIQAVGAGKHLLDSKRDNEFKNRFDSLELKRLYDKIQNFSDINYASLYTFVVRLESLVNQSFEALQDRLTAQEKTRQEEADKMYSRLLVDESKKKRRKKKHPPPVVQHPLPPAKILSPAIQSSETSKEPYMESIEEESKPLSVITVSITNKSKKEKKLEKAAGKKQASLKVVDQIKGIDDLSGEIQTLSTEGPDREFRHTWCQGALKNLKDALNHLEETLDINQLSRNKVFEEMNVARQLIESALEVILTHYPVVDKEERSVLHDVYTQGHQLHISMRQLFVPHNGKQVVPQNVLNILFALRSIPYALSQANACVYYPYTTQIKDSLSFEAKRLVKYVIKVNEQCAAEHPNPDISQELLKSHQTMIGQSLHFVVEVLKAVIDPAYGKESYQSVEEDLRNVIQPTKDVNEKRTAHPDESQMKEPTVQKLMTSPEEALKSAYIENRKDAIRAIHEAIIWVRIWMMSLVEKGQNSDERFNQRNLALQNVLLYLKWLHEKLTEDKMVLYNICYGALGLLRRAHKELSIAALYQGAYFEGALHIVESLGLRQCNDPCYLNAILRQYASHAARLPNLNKGDMRWMSRVHQVLSYPTPLVAEYREPAEGECHLYAMIQEVGNIVRQMKKLRFEKEQMTDDQFITVGPGGILLSPEYYEKENSKINQKAKDFINRLEQEKIFPALEKLLQLLRGGFSYENLTLL